MTPDTTSWWHRATPEQRLAQIDGGVECGMTSRQVAMASGVSHTTIRIYAANNGRRFPIKTKSTSGCISRAALNRRNRAAYLRGEHVDFWGNDEPAEGMFA